MSYGHPRDALSACSTEFLAVKPYFSSDVSLTLAQAPEIERLSRPAYPAGSESVPFRVPVNDPDGLHQVLLVVRTRETHSISAGGHELKFCRRLEGEEEAIVEFDYDGVIPSGKTITFRSFVARNRRVSKEEVGLRIEPLGGHSLNWENQLPLRQATPLVAELSAITRFQRSIPRTSAGVAVLLAACFPSISAHARPGAVAWGSSPP